MFSRVRVAIRFFFVGLAVGILLAPRSGEQTRQMLREKADQLLNDVLDAATLGTVETGNGTAARGAGGEGPSATPRSKTRTRAASSSGG